MAGTFSQSYAPELAGAVFQVPSQFIGQFLVDSIRKQFPRRNTQRGDFYMDMTHRIIDTTLTLIKPEDQVFIRVMLEKSVQEFLAGSIHISISALMGQGSTEKRRIGNGRLSTPKRSEGQGI